MLHAGAIRQLLQHRPDAVIVEPFLVPVNEQRLTIVRSFCQVLLQGLRGDRVEVDLPFLVAFPVNDHFLVFDDHLVSVQLDHLADPAACRVQKQHNRQIPVVRAVPLQLQEYPFRS